MLGLWLIDKDSSCLEPLVGNFATRAFRSFYSFKNLVTFDSSQIANLAIVSTQDLDVEPSVIEEWFQRHLPTIPRLYVGDEISNRVDSIPSNLSTREMVDEISKRLKKGEGSRLVYKDLWFERAYHRFKVMGQERAIILSPKESVLMQLFMQTPSQCVTREEIKKSVWEGRSVSPRTIDSHVSRIRRHLEDSEVVIDSIYGGGYIMR